MKRLSERQISKCETSKRLRCKCRCRGAYHGINRIEIFDGQRVWIQLPLVAVPSELVDAHRPPEKD